MQKLMADQLCTHLDDDHLLTSNQRGYHAHCSTIGVERDLTNDIFRAVEDNELTIVVFIDFRKVFEPLVHSSSSWVIPSYTCSDLTLLIGVRW